MEELLNIAENGFPILVEFDLESSLMLGLTLFVALLLVAVIYAKVLT